MTLAEATILIVDDEPVLRLTMGLVLRRAGATTLVAAHGVEALDLLAQHEVDAMVCDQNMSVMDGHSLLRSLHNHGRDVPTLLFVGGIDPEDTADLERMGVRYFLNKPLQPAALLRAVQSVLEPLLVRR